MSAAKRKREVQVNFRVSPEELALIEQKMSQPGTVNREACLRVQDELARTFYAEECAKSAWRVRQLERQINTMYYQRILACQDKSLCMRANWDKP
jgi:hypothetical protein